ncbi:scavenger receptor class F member 1 isoform X2 [Pipistrellus kuhlii]|uniref:scavenger receptor class F member 1 isoform X2 n=1 Tax=Pipistrellus kuhlii TaxID=59472 RepID=UPI00174F1A83|nr:scavenger receptor class F member 1 isoform X2 [Pipistrellus kuhlii]
MGLRLLLPLLLLWTPRTRGSALDPNGQHVCKDSSPSAELRCCPGWRQKDQECTIAVCEGPDACRENEVCVKPGLCRCKPGFFGAQCNSRCPGQYWGPDCRESCACHPHGQCAPDTGVCRCQDDRWGGRCEFECACGPHGRCDPGTGACHCEAGWWSARCQHRCQCNPVAARCDQATGNCVCQAGWWGRRCSFRCHCHGSPCAQESGRCACRPGWWGPECRLPCPAGRWGAQCGRSCGHCARNEPCAADTGSCESCEPGWNGTQCLQPCLPGTFGERCGQQCPRCQHGGACQPDTGHCQSCEPGWLGPRCEDPCPRGTFGEGCGSTCPACVQGACDAVTGECVCSAGYWGPSCNVSCPSGFHGNNCSAPCECPEGPCHPVSGACQLGSHSQDATLIAGILVPLLLLLLGIACCCAWCCWAARLDPKDSPAREGAAVSRRKLQGLWEALTSLDFALPCRSLSSHKLPWVTGRWALRGGAGTGHSFPPGCVPDLAPPAVSHHDPEVPFNHSFIEQPSAGWASDDSFSSDYDCGEDDEDPAYCVPPKEAMVPEAQAESPEASVVDGPFPAPEDASTPFAIPRTSSLARAKRPSVSFAEGTKFAPQNRQSSGELSNPLRKPKRLSRGGQPGPESQEAEESAGPDKAERDEVPPGAPSPKDSAAGPRRLPLSGQTVAERVEAIESGVQGSGGSVTTIYTLAGSPREPGGPVRAVLRRFGSFQKGQAGPKVKSAIPKPPRRALSRNKGRSGLAPGPASPSSGPAPNEEPAGASPPAGTGPEEAASGQRDGVKSSERLQELAPGGPPVQDAQKLADEEEQEEPQYENVAPISGPPEP